MKKTINSSYSWLIWLIATVFVFFQFILQLSPGVMANFWMHDFSANANQLSYLSAAFYYTYLILQIPAGLLYDRYGPRRTLSFAAFALALGCFWMAFSSSYTNALIARSLMGVGSTFAFIGMLYLVTRWFSPTRFAFMAGLSEMLAMIATALGTAGFAYLVLHTSWRISMLISAILAVLIMFVVFLLIRDQPHEHTEILIHEDQISIAKQLRIVIFNAQIWYAGLYGFAAFAIINGFAALWAESFFQTVYHLPLESAAKIVSMILVGIAVGGPTFGKLSEKWGHTPFILMTLMTLACVLMLIVLYCTQLPIYALYILIFLIGMCCSGYILCFDIARQNTDSHVHGTAMAMTNIIIMIGAPLLQSLSGYLVNNHVFGYYPLPAQTFQVSLTILPIIFFIAIFFAFKMKENRS